MVAPLTACEEHLEIVAQHVYLAGGRVCALP